MKLLVLSDIHGVLIKLEQLIQMLNPDIIIVPGDLPSSLDLPALVSAYLFGDKRKTYVNYIRGRFKERITKTQIRSSKKLIKQLVSYDLPVLLIHGNTETDSTRSWLNLFCHRYRNLHWLSDQYLYLEEFDSLFMGHGWVSYQNNVKRTISSGEIPLDISKTILLDTIGRANRKAKYKILVSHHPPLNTTLDFLPHKGIHVGSHSVREIMDSGFFDGVISGHIHESPGIYLSNKGWWGVNSGAVVEDSACFMDLESKSVRWLSKVVKLPNVSSFIYKLRHRLSYDK